MTNTLLQNFLLRMKKMTGKKLLCNYNYNTTTLQNKKDFIENKEDAENLKNPFL